LGASDQRAGLNSSMLRAYLDPRDPEIHSDLEFSACAGAAAHLAALAPGSGPVRAPAPGGQWIDVVRSDGPSEPWPELQWRQSVLAAVITRSAEALGVLTQMQPEQLARISDRRLPPWFSVEARALAALFGAGHTAGELLLTAVRVVEASDVPEAAKYLVQDIIVPEMELGLRVLQRDREKLDAGMEAALISHHHFYGTAAKDDYQGQLALAPLALAAFAHDRGVTTTIDSDYAPRWLIERRP
jgi:hypothetical protein